MSSKRAMAALKTAQAAGKRTLADKENEPDSDEGSPLQDNVRQRRRLAGANRQVQPQAQASASLEDSDMEEDQDQDPARSAGEENADANSEDHRGSVGNINQLSDDSEEGSEDDDKLSGDTSNDNADDADEGQAEQGVGGSGGHLSPNLPVGMLTPHPTSGGDDLASALRGLSYQVAQMTSTQKKLLKAVGMLASKGVGGAGGKRAATVVDYNSTSVHKQLKPLVMEEMCTSEEGLFLTESSRWAVAAKFGGYASVREARKGLSGRDFTTLCSTAIPTVERDNVRANVTKSIKAALKAVFTGKTAGTTKPYSAAGVLIEKNAKDCLKDHRYRAKNGDPYGQPLYRKALVTLGAVHTTDPKIAAENDENKIRTIPATFLAWIEIVAEEMLAGKQKVNDGAEKTFKDIYRKRILEVMNRTSRFVHLPASPAAHPATD